MTTPQIEDLLAARDITPDKFQLEAFEAIDRGNSVLVAAPTSSGKTLIAEYAIQRCLAEGNRVAYTTPIKALSNQKRRDLRTLLGDQVGLLTGDNVIQPDAPVLVMTTEVLRNMIYSGSDVLAQLGVVVLDEVHYLQDPYRGSVWEEVIIGLPQHIRLVCLSATATNANELASWISRVREQCEVVVETERPVKLYEHFLLFDKGLQRLHDFPTLRGTQPNPDVLRLLQSAPRRGSTGRGPNGRGSNGRGPNSKGGTVRPARPRRLEVLRYLAEQDRLPAIIFVFSRKGCDEAVQQCLEYGISLIDPVAQRQVREIAAQHVEGISQADLKSLHYQNWLDCLTTGVAAHHAGMIPPFKETIEECFAAGLLAAVFATETLSLGLNMPALSVVVEQLARFRGEGFVMLTPGEYTQLTGRAGRRGIDVVGHAHTLWSPYESFEQTAHLVASSNFEIDSSFRPSYNMAANLILTCPDRAAAIDLLNRSFAQFRANSRLPEWSEELTQRKEELKHARRRLRQLLGNKTQRAKAQQSKAQQSKAQQASRAKKSNRPNKHRQVRESRDVSNARRDLALCEARVARLENRIGLARGGLAETFDQITLLLEDFDCVDGWRLTPKGKQLSRIFHETDLLIVHALEVGLFDDHNPVALAGLVSCFTYEHRNRDEPGPARIPTAELANACHDIERLSSHLGKCESSYGMSLTRQVDLSFVECAYAWASGASLEDILDAALQIPGLTPGDFVRQIRSLADLLRQIMMVAATPSTRRNASAAIDLLDRGVVASTLSQ